MPEREIKSQLSDESESSENEVSDSSDKEKASQSDSKKIIFKDNFSSELEKSVKDLWYMSETDAKVEIFAGKKADSVTKEILVEQINISSETNIEERDFAEFFENLTKIQGWYGEEEKETAAKFSTVQKLLEENLKNLKIFKIGQIEIDIYVVGLNSQNILTGIMTRAVET